MKKEHAIMAIVATGIICFVAAYVLGSSGAMKTEPAQPPSVTTTAKPSVPATPPPVANTNADQGSGGGLETAPVPIPKKVLSENAQRLSRQPLRLSPEARERLKKRMEKKRKEAAKARP